MHIFCDMSRKSGILRLLLRECISKLSKFEIVKKMKIDILQRGPLP